MRVVIAGGNGYIGRNLTRLLRDRGDSVVWLSYVLGRAETAGAYAPDYEVEFDVTDPSAPWADEIAGANGLVNLSGYPISSRWSPRVKELLRSSRVDTGRALVDVLGALKPERRPRVFVSASGIGYYGERGDTVLAEDEPPGDDFLSQLARDWEAEALRASDHGVRTVIVRTGLVLGEVGLVPRMALPFRLFAGGPIGSGRQFVSWIHIDDIARVYAHALDTIGLSGPINASGTPLPMHEFARAFGHAMHRPSWFPVPRFALRLVLGEVADYTLMSQRASTGKLEGSGFKLRYTSAEKALANVLGR